MTKGWAKIKDFGDLERVLAVMLNKILCDSDPLIHAGRFASLANSWIKCRRLELDYVEIQQVHEEIAELRRQISKGKRGAIIELEERKE